MEQIKKHSLKRSFMVAVAITMMIVSLCSGIAIFGCYQFQKHILPDSNEVLLSLRTTAPDGTVTEFEQRYVLDKPSPLFRLMAVGHENDDMQGETEYLIERIESSYSMLSPKKQLAYRVSQVSMVVLPLLFAVIGI